MAMKRRQVAKHVLKHGESGQAIALFALLIPLMSIFAVLLMEYMVTASRQMDTVAAADLAAHAGAMEVALLPDGTIYATSDGERIAAGYFLSQNLPYASLSSVHCGRMYDRPACQVNAQFATPGWLLPRKWIEVHAIGYLAHGVTREDQ